MHNDHDTGLIFRLRRKAIQRQAGFSLTELLVVLAIITILAAILFSVFAHTREQGRQAACLSNMKQLTLALDLYRSDYDGANPGPGRPAEYCQGTPLAATYPPWMAGTRTSMPIPAQRLGQALDPAAQWVPCYGVQLDQSRPYDAVSNPLFPDWARTGPGRGALAPYLKNTQVFLCPSDPQPAKLLSYAMNSWAGYIPDSQVQRPAQFILLVDEQYTLNDAFFVAPDDCPANAHNNGSNLAFFDGHVKWSQADASTLNHCHNSVQLSLYCPSIPFDYSGKGWMCAHE